VKRVLSAIGVAAALVANPVFAADMATRAPVYKAPPPMPVFSWTGWYIGGNAGYGWGSNTNPRMTPDPTDLLGFGPFFAAGGNVFPNLTPKGFIGGGQIGYDWQFNNWVLGLVADFQGADITASGANGLRRHASAVHASAVREIGFPGYRARTAWLGG